MYDSESYSYHHTMLSAELLEQLVAISAPIKLCIAIVDHGSVQIVEVGMYL